MELVSLTEEQDILAQHYIEEGVLTPKFESDAQHIAIATILKVESFVSWNFKHMVNFFRIKQYNSINLKFGYSTIDIRTPKEVTYETKTKKDFKAVEFMRKVREEMSTLYNTDKRRYFEEIKKAMTDFKAKREKACS